MEMRPVFGWEKWYHVFENGRVYAHPRRVNQTNLKGYSEYTIAGKFKTPTLGNRGYLVIGLQANGEGRTRFLHRIVCESFHGPAPARHEVCHRDGNRLNNHQANLYWGTRSENMKDCIRHGRYVSPSKFRTINVPESS